MALPTSSCAGLRDDIPWSLTDCGPPYLRPHLKPTHGCLHTAYGSCTLYQAHTIPACVDRPLQRSMFETCQKNKKKTRQPQLSHKCAWMQLVTGVELQSGPRTDCIQCSPAQMETGCVCRLMATVNSIRTQTQIKLQPTRVLCFWQMVWSV